MVWGQSGIGIDDLVQRLRRNDSNLQSLTILRQRKLSDLQDFERLCDAIKANTQLTELLITSHAISTAAANLLADALQTNSSLRSISIGNSQLGNDSMVALARGIAGNRSLTNVDAEHKGLGPASAAALAHALATCHTLTSLNLNRNPIGDEGIGSLCSEAWANLTHLSLNDCAFGTAGLQALASLPSIARLRSLSLAFNDNLGPDSAPALTALCQAATALQRLQLQHTRVGDPGMTGIADGIQPGLQELDVGQTGITKSGGLELARALSRESCGLSSLNLERNNSVEDDVVSAVADAIKQRNQSHPTARLLQRLELSATGITPAALQPLATIPTLTHLGLLGCKLGPEGGIELARLLSACGGDASHPFPALTELIISACGLDTSASDAIISALTDGGCPKLTSIEIGGNPACEAEGFFAKIEQLRSTRPDLAVHWRSGDQAPV